MLFPLQLPYTLKYKFKNKQGNGMISEGPSKLAKVTLQRDDKKKRITKQILE
jgi:hypothetical protein